MTKRISIDELTKGNVWTLTESDLYRMIMEAKKNEDYAENEVRYMNIIHSVFEIQYLNREDEDKVAVLEAQHFEIFSSPNDGPTNAIAIRKKQIKKITDLTLENIHHFEPAEILELIANNLGTGWKGLSLSIQDIIESAFFIDCSVLPAYAMHRQGGVIDRRKADGYEVLELERGGWIEAVFIKAKPRMEKIRFENMASDRAGYDESDDDDYSDEELVDETPVKDDEDDEMNEDADENVQPMDDIENLEIIDEEEEE